MLSTSIWKNICIQNPERLAAYLHLAAPLICSRNAHRHLQYLSLLHVNPLPQPVPSEERLQSRKRVLIQTRTTRIQRSHKPHLSHPFRSSRFRNPDQQNRKQNPAWRGTVAQDLRCNNRTVIRRLPQVLDQVPRASARDRTNDVRRWTKNYVLQRVVLRTWINATTSWIQKWRTTCSLPRGP